jgi:hypothetical protein
MIIACRMLSGNCQERELHGRGAPYVVPTVVTLFPDVLALCPVVTCMTLVLTPCTCMQRATFSPTLAKGIRLKALSEAGNRGPWIALSELYVLGESVS